MYACIYKWMECTTIIQTIKCKTKAAFLFGDPAFNTRIDKFLKRLFIESQWYRFFRINGIPILIRGRANETSGRIS